MKFGLYSEHARRAIVAARSLVADRGYEATSGGIRQCRHDILALPDDHVAKRVLQFHDFFTLSSCRDLIFHVQEHRFTLPQIAEILNDFELKFLGFEHTDNSVHEDYLKHFPQDPTATDLACWDLYEQPNPDTFLNMYQFWIQKPRSAG